MKKSLDHILSGRSFERAEAEQIIDHFIDGNGTPEQMGALLIALRMKGETSAELLGFIDGIAKRATRVEGDFGELIDVCGTGGDGANTFNVSTGVAIVLASLGVKVAKHGNRGVSSASGSSDVLQALGVKSDLNAEESVQSLSKFGLSFLFAPAFHPILSKLASVRKNLGVYTLFNALGPILNPAPLTKQMIGVYSPALMMKTAEVLRARGMKEAFIVHGSDGLDELTLSGESSIVHLKNNDIRKMTVSPEDFGLSKAPLLSVKGGNAAENAEILKRIFEGAKGPGTDLIVMNSAAALVLAGKDADFKSAAKQVSDILASGKTHQFYLKLKANSP